MASRAAAGRSGRRRTSPWVGLVVVLAVLGLLVATFLVADRVVRDRTEAAVGDALQTEFATPQRPSVQIPGFPFLTQAAVRTFATVRVAALEVGHVGDSGLSLRRLDLTLTDVIAGEGFRSVSAAQVEGRAEADLTALGQLAGRTDLTYAGGGRVQIKAQTSVLGSTVEAVISGRVQLDVDAQTLTLVDPKVQVAGVSLPDSASQLLIRTLVHPVRVVGLPYGLRLSSLELTDAGLTAGLSGQNVAIVR